MGYIFDALNKTPDDKPKADPPEAKTSGHAPEQTAHAPVATAIDAQTADNQDAPAPIRLADVKLSMDTGSSDSEVAQVRAVAADASPEAKPQAAATPPAPPQQDPKETKAKAKAKPKKTAKAKQPKAQAPARAPKLELVKQEQEQPATLKIHAAPPKPRRSLWSRLIGRALRGRIDDRLVTMTSPASAVAEEYRSLRTSILARHDNQRNLVHTITSATPQEGKTITSVNLGLSFAELRNRNTIIVECDLRLPTFGKLLNCDTHRPGLINYLRGEAQLSDVIQKIEGSSLHVLPAGGRVSDEAVQLISSPRMTQLIQSLRAKYDHVIIDTPPVIPLADAGILGSQSEEVLLVARMRRTPRTLIEQAVSTLESYNALVNGIIATDNPRARGRGYKYGYKYGYGYGYSYTSNDRKSRNERDAA